jgi:colanic acid/amylovoran biosynthesis protein
MHKAALPLVTWGGRSKNGGSPASWPGQVDLVRAVREADLVVASGGGYVNDVWWWHGAGVLGVLAMAQKMGKPTAMFGQGIGPLTNRLLRRQLRETVGPLAVVGLREGLLSPQLLSEAGRAPSAMTVTGDDALEIATPRDLPSRGSDIGLNVRIAGYTGVDPSLARRVRAAVIEAAHSRDVRVIALPVSRYQRSPASAESGQDLEGSTSSSADVERMDLRTPEELADSARRCRLIVTTSYHAAVYGLANGVMTVCLVAHPYYDAKFAGLAALFPAACTLVRLDAPAFDARLKAAIDDAWQREDSVRRSAHSAALEQVSSSRHLYEELRRIVDGCLGTRTTEGTTDRT